MESKKKGLSIIFIKNNHITSVRTVKCSFLQSIITYLANQNNNKVIHLHINKI